MVDDDLFVISSHPHKKIKASKCIEGFLRQLYCSPSITCMFYYFSVNTLHIAEKDTGFLKFLKSI